MKNPVRRPATAVCVFCLLLVFTHARAQEVEELSFPVEIAIDGKPRMTPSEVATIAVKNLSRAIEGVVDSDGTLRPSPPFPTIQSMVCTSGEEAGRYLPTVHSLSWNTIWIVRAEGLFSKSVPGGGSIHADAGFLVIDDETGRIVGKGTTPATAAELRDRTESDPVEDQPLWEYKPRSER